MEIEQSYICPICGMYSSSEDRFVVCRYCGCEDVILLSDEEIENTRHMLETLPPSVFKKYVVNEKGDVANAFEIGLAIREYLRQKYVFSDSRFSKKKFNERIEHEYQAKLEYDKEMAELASQVYGIPNPYNKPKCPTCQSTNIKKISGLSKAVSVGMFGLFSQKVKKTWHCNNCGHEW